MRFVSILFVFGLVCACSDPAEQTSPPDQTVVAEPSAPEPVEYSIHEWGLLDIDMGDNSVELAAGPGHVANDPAPNELGTSPMRPSPMRPSPMRPSVGRRKPVLYFHLANPTEDFTFNLSVNVGSGRIVEHFPTANVSERGVRWMNVGLAEGSCSGGPYPSVGSPLCTAVSDGYCEAAELDAYEANDAGCLTFEGAQQNFLFYRGAGAAPTLPVSIERRDDGSIQVTNNSMEVVGPIWRLTRDPLGSMHVARAEMPGRGDSIDLSIPTAPSDDANRAALRTQLTTIGLTPGEAGAFERAWVAELFMGADPMEALSALMGDPRGEDIGVVLGTTGGREGDTPKVFADAVLFFLPQDAIDGFARLDASPPPTTTVRAMAVRAGWRDQPSRP